MEIFVNTLSGKWFSIHAKFSDTIDKIKTAIWESEGVPTEQQKLLFGGKQLEDECTVSEYQIVKKSHLHLLVHSEGSMCVFVETHTDKSLTVDVEPFNRVKSVKNKIQEAEGIPADLQRLTLRGMDLDNG